MKRLSKTPFSHHLFKPWQPCELREAIEACRCASGSRKSEAVGPSFAGNETNAGRLRTVLSN